MYTIVCWTLLWFINIYWVGEKLKVKGHAECLQEGTTPSTKTMLWLEYYITQKELASSTQ